MDVPPPWYQISHPACSGQTRGCSGGDQACREQAAKDGYVAISNYSFCRKDEVHAEPTVSGFGLLAILAVAAGAAVVGWRRRRRA